MNKIKTINNIYDMGAECLVPRHMDRLVDILVQICVNSKINSLVLPQEMYERLRNANQIISGSKEGI